MFEQCQDIIFKVVTEEFKWVHYQNFGKERHQTFTCINTLAISSQLFFLLTPPMKMGQTQCSETLAHKIQI